MLNKMYQSQKQIKSDSLTQGIYCSQKHRIRKKKSAFQEFGDGQIRNYYLTTLASVLQDAELQRQMVAMVALQYEYI